MAKVDAKEHGDELRKGQVKEEIEGFITAAQSQALRKNSKKNHLSTSRTSRQNSGYVWREGSVNIDFKNHLKIHFNQKKLFQLKTKLFQLKKKPNEFD